MYQYVVCGRNVALGVYPSMADADASCRAEGFSPTVGKLDECYREYSRDDGERLSVVAVRPSDGPSPLFH